MNIMVDLDGVIYFWAKAVYTEQVVYHNETRDYDTFWKSFEQEHNSLYFDNLVQVKHLYATQTPDRQDVAFLNKLTESGHKLYYVTNRPLSVQLDTELWMKRFDLPQRKNLVFTKDKVAVCNSLGISLAFEDRPYNINQLCEAGVTVVVVHSPCQEGINYSCQTVNHIYETKGLL